MIEIGPNLRSVLLALVPASIILAGAAAVFIGARAGAGSKDVRAAKRAITHIYLVHGIPVEFELDYKLGVWYWRTDQPDRSGGGQATLADAQQDAALVLAGRRQPAQESDV